MRSDHGTAEGHGSSAEQCTTSGQRRKGFTRISNAFMTDSDIPYDARRVGVALAVFANQEGLAWPSDRKLAEVTGLGINKVQRARSWLHKAGLIVRGRRSLSESGAFAWAWRISVEILRRSAKAECLFPAPAGANLHARHGAATSMPGIEVPTSMPGISMPGVEHKLVPSEEESTDEELKKREKQNTPTLSVSEKQDGKGGRSLLAERFFVWLAETWPDLSLSRKEKGEVRGFIVSSVLEGSVLGRAAKRILDPIDVTDSYNHAGSRLAVNLPAQAEAVRRVGERAERRKSEMERYLADKAKQNEAERNEVEAKEENQERLYSQQHALRAFALEASQVSTTIQIFLQTAYCEARGDVKLTAAKMLGLSAKVGLELSPTVRGAFEHALEKG